MMGWRRSRSRLTQVVGILREHRFEELRVRSVQPLSSLGERSGLFGDFSLPYDAAFLNEFPARLHGAEALPDSFRLEASSAPVIGLWDIAATAASLPEASLPQVIH